MKGNLLELNWNIKHSYLTCTRTLKFANMLKLAEVIYIRLQFFLESKVLLKEKFQIKKIANGIMLC